MSRYLIDKNQFRRWMNNALNESNTRSQLFRIGKHLNENFLSRVSFSEAFSGKIIFFFLCLRFSVCMHVLLFFSSSEWHSAGSFSDSKQSARVGGASERVI